jgi:hypothetical protein
MAYRTAYERAVALAADGERLRQKRLDAIGRPPPDPYETDRYLGAAVTGPQNPPPYKDAYARAVEALEEMDRRRWPDYYGEPQPKAVPSETAQRLAARLVDPNRPQPKPTRDPRIGASAHVLANRVMGRADDFGDDAADGADDH